MIPNLESITEREVLNMLRIILIIFISFDKAFRNIISLFLDGIKFCLIWLSYRFYYIIKPFILNYVIFFPNQAKLCV